MANTRTSPPSSSGSSSTGWRAYRQEITFLTLFVLLLGGGFTLLSLNSVNDRVIEPFTAGVARVSGFALDLIGQDVTMVGTVIRNERFAVNIRNGCNGVETMIIFLAAVLAFPAPWRARLLGLVLGCLVIQLINLVRVVALFLTGAYLPAFFDSSHTVVWQTVVILCGVLLWIFWAHRFATPPQAPATVTAE
jgi:exosortase H (IPTLxxWG-CTERM-specific)